MLFVQKETPDWGFYNTAKIDPAHQIRGKDGFAFNFLTGAESLYFGISPDAAAHVDSSSFRLHEDSAGRMIWEPVAGQEGLYRITLKDVAVPKEDFPIHVTFLYTDGESTETIDCEIPGRLDCQYWLWFRELVWNNGVLTEPDTEAENWMDSVCVGPGDVRYFVAYVEDRINGVKEAIPWDRLTFSTELLSAVSLEELGVTGRGTHAAMFFAMRVNHEAVTEERYTLSGVYNRQTIAAEVKVERPDWGFYNSHSIGLEHYVSRQDGFLFNPQEGVDSLYLGFHPDEADFVEPESVYLRGDCAQWLSVAPVAGLSGVYRITLQGNVEIPQSFSLDLAWKRNRDGQTEDIGTRIEVNLYSVYRLRLKWLDIRSGVLYESAEDWCDILTVEPGDTVYLAAYAENTESGKRTPLLYTALRPPGGSLAIKRPEEYGLKTEEGDKGRFFVLEAGSDTLTEENYRLCCSFQGLLLTKSVEIRLSSWNFYTAPVVDLAHFVHPDDGFAFHPMEEENALYFGIRPEDWPYVDTGTVTLAAKSLEWLAMEPVGEGIYKITLQEEIDLPHNEFPVCVLWDYISDGQSESMSLEIKGRIAPALWLRFLTENEEGVWQEPVEDNGWCGASLSMPPGDAVPLMAYLEDAQGNRTPINPKELIVSGGFTVKMPEELGWATSGEQAAYFFVLEANPASQDGTYTIQHPASPLVFTAHVCLPDGGFYRGSTVGYGDYLDEFDYIPGESGDTLYFLFRDNFLQEVELQDVLLVQGKAFVGTLEEMERGVYTITLNEAARQSMGFQLEVLYTFRRGDLEYEGIRKLPCHRPDLQKRSAHFQIDGKNYWLAENGQVITEDEESGEERIGAWPEGFAYDAATNTISLDNIQRQGLYVYAIPDNRLTIALDGDTTIATVNRTALGFYNGVNATITGSGTLSVVAAFDDNGETGGNGIDVSAKGSLTLSGSVLIKAEAFGSESGTKDSAGSGAENSTGNGTGSNAESGTEDGFSHPCGLYGGGSALTVREKAQLYVYSSGNGLEGFQTLTFSENTQTEVTAENSAGISFDSEGGALTVINNAQLCVHSSKNGLEGFQTLTFSENAQVEVTAENGTGVSFDSEGGILTVTNNAQLHVHSSGNGLEGFQTLTFSENAQVEATAEDGAGIFLGSKSVLSVTGGSVYFNGLGDKTGYGLYSDNGAVFVSGGTVRLEGYTAAVLCSSPHAVSPFTLSGRIRIFSEETGAKLSLQRTISEGTEPSRYIFGLTEDNAPDTLAAGNFCKAVLIQESDAEPVTVRWGTDGASAVTLPEEIYLIPDMNVFAARYNKNGQLEEIAAGAVNEGTSEIVFISALGKEWTLFFLDGGFAPVFRQVALKDCI